MICDPDHQLPAPLHRFGPGAPRLPRLPSDLLLHFSLAEAKSPSKPLRNVEKLAENGRNPSKNHRLRPEKQGERPPRQLILEGLQLLLFGIELQERGGPLARGHRHLRGLSEDKIY